MLMQGLGYNRYRRMDTEVRATTRVERGQEQARRPEQNKNEKEDRQRERAGTHFQFSPSGASCRRSLALLASFARFFFSFFWKKKKPARHVLLRRAFIEALAAWRRLVRFDGIGPWQRERRKEKEEERERKNSKACSCFFFAPVKKGGGALAPFHSTSEPTACTRRLGIDSHASRWSWIGEKELVCLPRAVGKRPPKDSLLLLSPFPFLSTLTSTQTTGFSPTARSSARSRS